MRSRGAAAFRPPRIIDMTGGRCDHYRMLPEKLDVEYPCPSPIENRWFLLQASAAPVVDGASLMIFHVDITARKVLSDWLAALASGDELLAKIAERARRLVRSGDLLCRFDGDEFVVVRPATTRHGAAELASRMRTALAEPFQVGALELRSPSP